MARGGFGPVSLEPPAPGSPVNPQPPQAHLVRRHTAPPSTPKSREQAAPFLAGRITCGAAASPAHSIAADWSPLWTSPASESDAARERRGRLRAVGRLAAARLPGGEGGTESASSRLAEEVDAGQQAAMAAAQDAVARLNTELAQEEADSRRRREKLKEQAAAAAATEAHERVLQALTAALASNELGELQWAAQQAQQARIEAGEPMLARVLQAIATAQQAQGEAGEALTQAPHPNSNPTCP